MNRRCGDCKFLGRSRYNNETVCKFGVNNISMPIWARREVEMRADECADECVEFIALVPDANTVSSEPTVEDTDVDG